MYDELTEVDIKKMKEELEDRILNQRPVLIAEVKRCREFGDLSENFEYKEAKRAKNRNESRIRYLQAMIKTAKIIEDNSSDDTVGLYDDVEIFLPEDDETMRVKVVTTVRIDPGSGMISNQSPLGKEILGKKVGDVVTVKVNDSFSYPVEIRSITKSEDDGSTPILPY